MLTPPLRMLTLASHNQIFLDKTLPDILELVLKDNGMSSFDVRLAESYQPISYVCQFNETYFGGRLRHSSGARRQLPAGS